MDSLETLTVEDLVSRERDLGTQLVAVREEIERRHKVLLARESYRMPNLSDRQTQVLAGICRGLLNKQIAGELNVTERTVKFHVTALLDKFEVHSRSRTGLVAVVNQRTALNP